MCAHCRCLVFFDYSAKPLLFCSPYTISLHHQVPSDTFAYFHRNFLQGKPELVKSMSGSKSKVTSSREYKMQQQLTYATAREQEAAAAANRTSRQAGFAQPILLARGMMAGGDTYFPDNRTAATAGEDPRLGQFLLHQRAQQARLNGMGLLEQPRLASVGDPELHMRLLAGRGGSGPVYGGYHPASTLPSQQLVAQQLPFDGYHHGSDPSFNVAAANQERFVPMRTLAQQQQQGLSQAPPWMPAQQNDAAAAPSGAEAAAGASGTAQETANGDSSAPASQQQGASRQQLGQER